MRLLQRTFRATILAVAIISLLALPLASQAVTPNYSVATSSLMMMPFHVSGQYGSTTTGVIRYNTPFPVRLVGCYFNARASGGTSPTLTIDVKQGGTTLLTAPTSITVGTVSECSVIAAPDVVDEAAITVDFTIGGSSPTWNDVTIVLVFLRK